MDVLKFEDYEVEEYLKSNADYKIASTVINNQAKTLTYGDILNYIYDLECELAGANARIDTLEQTVSDQKNQINGYIVDQEIYTSGYQGTQKENDELKLEITQLQNELDKLKENYRLYKDANDIIKRNSAELQKQLDGLKANSRQLIDNNYIHQRKYALLEYEFECLKNCKDDEIRQAVKNRTKEICLKIIKGQPEPIKEKWLEFFKKEYDMEME